MIVMSVRWKVIIDVVLLKRFLVCSVEMIWCGMFVGLVIVFIVIGLGGVMVVLMRIVLVREMFGRKVYVVMFIVMVVVIMRRMDRLRIVIYCFWIIF